MGPTQGPDALLYVAYGAPANHGGEEGYLAARLVAEHIDYRKGELMFLDLCDPDDLPPHDFIDEEEPRFAEPIIGVDGVTLAKAQLIEAIFSILGWKELVGSMEGAEPSPFRYKVPSF